VHDGPLRHLIISREFPPAAYAPGGIGTYVSNIARLLAKAGETVHVIGERWSGAPLEREELCEGRLIIHRVRLDEPLPGPGTTASSRKRQLRLLGTAAFPAQRFAWQAGLLAETLVEQAHLDVIEAQEWEAPLYYFLLRRALGLGPARQPPCIIHLHSPTEFIFRHNEWAPGHPEYLRTIRLEEYCLGAADKLLCPSRYLARQVAARYGIPVDAITVIPYPAGDFPFVPRAAAAWNGGRIVFIGRLEPRKGLIEFVDAAVEVALTHDAACFDFIGDDLWYEGSLTMRRYLERRIPRPLRKRFEFHGRQPRERLPEFLARARAAVVPSRWENFPNTCIEAMCSGLPVVASPNGGMEEMLEDGVTGWIAPSQSAAGLAVALRRALETTPAHCEAMGRAAADAIHGCCGNEVTTGRHLARRAEVARRGVKRSNRLAAALDPGGTATRRAADEPGRQGIAIASIPPASHPDGADTRALSGKVRALLEQQRAAGIALVPSSVTLAPAFLDECSKVLERNPEVGLISCWVDDGARGFLRPCPAFPYQWLQDDVAPVAVIRAEAFAAAGGLRQELPLGYARWDLHNATLAAGWLALTYPAVLATTSEPIPRQHDSARDAELRRLMYDRFPEAFLRDTPFLAALAGARFRDRGLRVRDVLRMPLREQVTLAFDAMRRPRHALGWLRARWIRLGR
jgi:glycogen(starch) synthase